MQFELIRALRRMALNARRARESALGVEILYNCFALSKDANGEPPTRAELWPDVRLRGDVLQNYFGP